MVIAEHLLEIREYTGSGYSPVIDYGVWRVAVLRYVDELLPDRLDAMQRHDETDEVFVLLRGRFILFIGEGKGRIERVHAENLVPLRMYNVRRGVWHTHTLSEDAVVLIVENADTTKENSPSVALDTAQKETIRKRTAELWRA